MATAKGQRYQVDLNVTVGYSGVNRELARESDRVAYARYQASVESFLIGRMSVLELNDARDAKDLARQDYVQQLYYYWYYYNIRSVTLWDYATGTPIKADVDALLADEN